ncbi:hypothetical protein HMPREF3226_00721 [Prevotella corporis]|uniref:Uncharacterized protein n=1 Tax=Prevotella corporis TaxID=28128 RepID=A0A133QHM8_9BACT|nr:hypothetical protein HMPREF3226_00721 [Prevotella corporis]
MQKVSFRELIGKVLRIKIQSSDNQSVTKLKRLLSIVKNFYVHWSWDVGGSKGRIGHKTVGFTPSSGEMAAPTAFR